MLLGDIISRLTSPAGAADALGAVGDLALMASVRAECAMQGEALGEYAQGAVRRFSNLASDEDWVQMMGKLESADNPSAACLSAMLHWSVKRDRAEAAAPVPHSGCTCGGGGGCHGAD